MNKSLIHEMRWGWCILVLRWYWREFLMWSYSDILWSYWKVMLTVYIDWYVFLLTGIDMRCWSETVATSNPCLLLLCVISWRTITKRWLGDEDNWVLVDSHEVKIDIASILCYGETILMCHCLDLGDNEVVQRYAFVAWGKVILAFKKWGPTQCSTRYCLL